VKRIAVMVASMVCAFAAQAQRLDLHFACGFDGNMHGEKTFFADNGTVRIDGSTILEFYWDSAIYHGDHGLECLMTERDGLHAEFTGDESRSAWRVLLDDAAQSRKQQGYTDRRSLNCTVRFTKDGDEIHVNPSCPALCGSRANFSEFRVDTKTGKCRYEE
jgi:hypothetical protein